MSFLLLGSSIIYIITSCTAIHLENKRSERKYHLPPTSLTKGHWNSDIFFPQSDFSVEKYKVVSILHCFCYFLVSFSYFYTNWNRVTCIFVWKWRICLRSQGGFDPKFIFNIQFIFVYFCVGFLSSLLCLNQTTKSWQLMTDLRSRCSIIYTITSCKAANTTYLFDINGRPGQGLDVFCW